MENLKQALASVGLHIPKILLPNKNVDLHKFSVIACDQFSAKPEYWQSVENVVGDAPSALRITLPEVFLNDNAAARTVEINRTMSQYLSEKVLTSVGECFIYLRRRTTSGIRRGLIAALDLEQYDYSKESKALIRATEATVVDRLPPRIAIRRDAPIELPHIMVLINDKQNLLMDYFDSRISELDCLYDFTLMCSGGHSTGYCVDSYPDLKKTADILAQLKEQSGDNFLFAMGDGNHSLAAAKACWEETKASLTAEQAENHPARYALVEIVSLHDPALLFEPIHRLLYNVDPEQVTRELELDSDEVIDAQMLQPKLDKWLQSHPEAELEYIHGEQECLDLAAQSPDRLAIIFPPFDRDSLFDVVRKNGAFVRKSFSMGEAVDKRYYLECRVIK